MAVVGDGTIFELLGGLQTPPGADSWPSLAGRPLRPAFRPGLDGRGFRGWCASEEAVQLNRWDDDISRRVFQFYGLSSASSRISLRLVLLPLQLSLPLRLLFLFLH